MATLVKLTYTQTGKSTLINLDTMKSAFRIHERQTSKYATRINFMNDDFVIVDEELQEILKLAQDHTTGEFQSTDWVELDTGEGMFPDTLRDDYQRNVYQAQRDNNYQQNRRPRQYNNNNNYNNRY
jgi:formylmethanofuran dehydrogenase subunit E